QNCPGSRSSMISTIRPSVPLGSTAQRARRAPVPLGEVDTWTLPNTWRSRSQKAKKALSFQTGSSGPAASAWMGSDSGPQSDVVVGELRLSVIWFSFGWAGTARHGYDADQGQRHALEIRTWIKTRDKLISVDSRAFTGLTADGSPSAV